MDAVIQRLHLKMITETSFLLLKYYPEKQIFKEMN